jgi:glycosyltransferase involved in cell wall biosynthesis
MIVHDRYPDSRVAREAREAVAAGFDVDVIAMRAPGEAARETLDGVDVRRLPVDRGRSTGALSVAREYVGFTALATLHAALLDGRRRYELVQVHNPPDFLMLAALLPKLRGAGVILDVHDLAPDVFGVRFAGRSWSGAADAVLRRIEVLAARAAAQVITVHEPYRDELVRRGVPQEKLDVVMNSVDERLLDGLPAPTGGAGHDAFRIVYHGAITPSYGLETVVDAVALVARELPRCRLEIYGHGDSTSAVELRAHERRIGERVHVSGFLPQREVLTRIAGAAVGVIPNRSNRLNRFALSTKLFEYVLLGIPVVSADLPTIRAHFSRDELLYVRPEDPHELAAALLRVAADPAGAAERAPAARARYEQYRWERNAARYRDALVRAGTRRRPFALAGTA